MISQELSSILIKIKLQNFLTTKISPTGKTKALSEVPLKFNFEFYDNAFEIFPRKIACNFIFSSHQEYLVACNNSQRNYYFLFIQ